MTLYIVVYLLVLYYDKSRIFMLVSGAVTDCACLLWWVDTRGGEAMSLDELTKVVYYVLAIFFQIHNNTEIFKSKKNNR